MDELHESDDPRHGYSLDAALMTELEKHLGKQTATVLMAVLDEEIERRERSAFLDGFKTATRWVAGPKLADAAFAFLAGDTARSDGEIAAELGVTKQAVGKFHRKLRRNAGMGLRAPQCANGPEVRAAVEMKKKKAESEKQKDAQ